MGTFPETMKSRPGTECGFRGAAGTGFEGQAGAVPAFLPEVRRACRVQGGDDGKARCRLRRNALKNGQLYAGEKSGGPPCPAEEELTLWAVRDRAGTTGRVSGDTCALPRLLFS